MTAKPLFGFACVLGLIAFGISHAPNAVEEHARAAAKPTATVAETASPSAPAPVGSAEWKANVDRMIAN